MALCLESWDAQTHMSKSEWRAACERSVEGLSRTPSAEPETANPGSTAPRTRTGWYPESDADTGGDNNRAASSLALPSPGRLRYPSTP